MDDLVPLPPRGRVYRSEHRVRLGDVRADGRLRLDAFARYLQDIANDDGLDAGVEGIERWVLRRMIVATGEGPRFTDVVGLATWCSGVGSRWAERRTSMDGGYEAAALWVAVDPYGRPVRVPPAFDEVWAESAGGRKVSARLSHPDPPEDAPSSRWPLRRTDVDLLGHVNNAAYWEPVEEHLADVAARPGRWEIEFRSEVPPAAEVDVVVDGRTLWWRTQAGVHASVRYVDAR